MCLAEAAWAPVFIREFCTYHVPYIYLNRYQRLRYAEDPAADSDKRYTVFFSDGVISRAFEWMEKTLPRLANSLKVGGRVYFMKGPGVADELKVFHPEDFGYKLIAKHFYTIPNSTQDRALVILERVE